MLSSRPVTAALVTVFVLLAIAPACKRSGGSPAAPLRVAAAADLAHAFPELAAEYETRTGVQVDLTFGSSGQLAKQLADGAPFDVFVAANQSFVDEAVRSGACDGTTKALYARGRLAVWGSRTKGLAPPARFAELGDARFVKIAIANPEHAPYGKAAKQALERAGIWDAVASRIVYGENVTQALQFAQSGNAEVAIIASSLAHSHPDGAAVEVDSSLHEPLDQALVVCKRGAARERGRDFALFVSSTTGRELMKRHGFLLPAEAATASAGAP